MAVALRLLEQRNKDLTAEVTVLRKDGETAEQDKNVLVTRLKKTDKELADLRASCHERDLQLALEQARRAKQELEREKVQIELRQMEARLVSRTNRHTDR